MARKAYARRYAQAIFEIALEDQQLDRWQDDLQRIAGALSDPAVMAALENPRIAADVREKLLAEALGESNPLVVNLVRLLISRGSLGMIVQIAGEFRRLVDSYRGIEPAQVVTAVPLDEDDIEKLAARLSAIIDRKVVIEAEVDPSVLGGIVVRVAGKLLDGSTRSRLAALRRQLASAERRG